MPDTNCSCGFTGGSKNTCGGNGFGKEGPRETVCIEVNRVLDSCRDRDCYENVRVFLTDAGQELIGSGISSGQVRVKDAGIAWTYIGIDPVQFNRGFYTVTVRCYVKLIFECCIAHGQSREFDGIAALEKQAVLFGGENSVSIFRSGSDCSDFCGGPEPCLRERSIPTAVVETVDPIVLGCRILDPLSDRGCPVTRACEIPDPIAACLSGPIAQDMPGDGGCCRPCGPRVLTVSLGVFSLIRMVRPAQYLISASEFIIPDKECTSGAPSDPCSLFRSMAFPIGEFSPTGIPCTTLGCGQPADKGSRCGCGSGS